MALNSFLSFFEAGRIEITESPSRPRTAKTIEITPFASIPIARVTTAFCGKHQGVREELLGQRGEIQAVLGDVRDALRFTPKDFHKHFVDTKCLWGNQDE
ncbi:hypothetical protein [Bradyrhizobium sp. SZCCHNR3078]|uniref:hypothetical protein n=1 Tax=unclassified Bradyrhizobium TaxID=2631580 RepID=UPI0039656EA2